MSFERRFRAGLARDLSGDLEIGTSPRGQPVCISTDDLRRHAHFIGPTGMGKTRALCLLLKQLIDREDSAVIVLDPLGAPGGLYHTLKAHCYDHCPDRLVTLDPHDVDVLGYATGFNPLLQGVDATVQAQYGVEHLQATNPSEALNQPAGIMLKVWAFRLLLGMISAELAMGDASRILAPDAGKRLRLGLTEALRASHPDVADHWQRFYEDTTGRGARVSQEYERIIGSTERRISQYVLNQRLRYMLSARSHAIDFDSVFSERQVLLVNLSAGNIMLPEDQRLLGMQIVHEVCRAAKAQGEEPTPCYLAIDEFQNFLTPDIYEALNFGRNFNLRLLIAHQNLQQLVTVAGQEWRIFHAVMSNATLKVVFGGLPPEDLAALSKHLYGAYLDNYRVKQEIYRTTQLSRVEEVTTHHENRGYASGTATGTFTGTGQSQAMPGDGSPPWSGPHVSSTTMSQAQSQAYSQIYSDSYSEGSATGYMVVPAEPIQELSSREFMSLDEQLWEHAARLSRQSPQHAVLQRDRAHEPEPFRVAGDPPPLVSLLDLSKLDLERLPAVLWAAPLGAIRDEARARLEGFERVFCATQIAAVHSFQDRKDKDLLGRLRVARGQRDP